MKQITKNTLNANGDHILIADETWGNILLPHIIVLDEYYWKMHEWCHEHPSEYSYTVTYEMEFNPILFDPVPVNNAHPKFHFEHHMDLNWFALRWL